MNEKKERKKVVEEKKAENSNVNVYYDDGRKCTEL
jgi:hypothetical protein